MDSWYRKENELLQELQSEWKDATSVPVWRLGQCGQALRLADSLLLIDPVLCDLKDPQGNTRRLYPAPFDPAQLNADVVFCTHLHRDHFEAQTLKALREANPELKIVLPAGLKDNAREIGFADEQILPVNDGESLALGPVQIGALRTAHPEEQVDAQGNDTNLAFVLEGDGVKLVHLGDTYLTPKLLEKLKAQGPVDVLFAPINGQDYFRTARGCIGNLSGYEAARLAKEMQADLTIPMHFDMMTGNTCSPLPFAQSMLEEYPEGRFALPRLGECVRVPQK